jgi:hypothetical protein
VKKRTEGCEAKALPKLDARPNTDAIITRVLSWKYFVPMPMIMIAENNIKEKTY